MKLPACVPSAIELDEGLFALLLSGHTKQHETYPDARLKNLKELCVDLRFKLNINISFQVWFMIAADLKAV